MPLQTDLGVAVALQVHSVGAQGLEGSCRYRSIIEREVDNAAAGGAIVVGRMVVEVLGSQGNSALLSLHRLILNRCNLSLGVSLTNRLHIAALVVGRLAGASYKGGCKQYGEQRFGSKGTHRVTPVK